MNNISHQFLVDEAVAHGVEQAILLSNIRFWLQKNKTNNANCHDGFYWTYNSAKVFSELFPYMSRQSITRYLKQLCDKGILLQGNYNEAGYDRTFWYTIPSEFACKPSNIKIAQNEPSIAQNEPSIAQNEPSIAQNKPTIPDINTDITQISISSLGEAEKNSDEPELGQEMQDCFNWAIQHQFWKDKVTSISRFLTLYTNNKPDNLKAQYQRFLQAQKNPLEGNQAGLILVTNNTNKDYSNDYFAKYNPPKQKPSTADRQLYSCYRGDIKDDYDAGIISYETYREGMRRYATN